MRILFYRYGSICEPDIIAGFEELGHSVTQITEEIINKNMPLEKSAYLVSNALLNHSHDLVFTVNFFPIISDICNIFKIPYVCWIVDSPVMELYTTSIQNSYNRIFLFDHAQFIEIAPLNPGHVFHFPLATNVFHKQQSIRAATVSQRKHFSSDISFVGSLYTEKCPYNKLHNPPAYLQGYLNGIIEAQLRVYGYYFIDEILTDDIVSSFKEHLPEFYKSPYDTFLTDRITVSQLYIGNKITVEERLRTMQLLSENFSFNLYTGSDTSSLSNIHNCGIANTFTEMPIIFHESKVNLNTTSKSIRSGIPLRVFDIMACEGFVLSNYQPELNEFFDAGIDFDYYDSFDSLIEKADYYLHHEKERIEIAHNGYEKVLSEYTYPKRLDLLLSIAFSV